MFPHGKVEASLGIGDPANSQVYLMLFPFYSSMFITEFHIYILPPSITLCSFSWMIRLINTVFALERLCHFHHYPKTTKISELADGQLLYSHIFRITSRSYSAPQRNQTQALCLACSYQELLKPEQMFIINYYYWLLGVHLVIGTVQTQKRKADCVPRVYNLGSKLQKKRVGLCHKGGGRRRGKKIKLVWSCCFTKSERKKPFGLVGFVGSLLSCSSSVLGVSPSVTAVFPSLESFLS